MFIRGACNTDRNVAFFTVKVILFVGVFRTFWVFSRSSKFLCIRYNSVFFRGTQNMFPLTVGAEIDFTEFTMQLYGVFITGVTQQDVLGTAPGVQLS
jgi:hypothetical protein